MAGDNCEGKSTHVHSRDGLRQSDGSRRRTQASAHPGREPANQEPAVAVYRRWFFTPEPKVSVVREFLMSTNGLSCCSGRPLRPFETRGGTLYRRHDQQQSCDHRPRCFLSWPRNTKKREIHNCCGRQPLTRHNKNSVPLSFALSSCCAAA